MSTRFTKPFGLGIVPQVLIATARRSLNRISCWWSYRKTVRELGRLDSHILKDLGIQWSEIAWIAHEATQTKYRRQNKNLRRA